MLKTLPQKEKNEQYSSERKNKRGKKKSKKSNNDFSKNIIIATCDAKSSADLRKNSQAGKARTQMAPKCSLTVGQEEKVWDPARDVAGSLFPNAEPSMNEEEMEAEMVARAMQESLETAFLEKCILDEIARNEAACGPAENPEDEDMWSKVQRNLPTPESEKDCKTSDANNNSGVQPIENLSIPAVKLESRHQTVLTRKEDKDHGHRSEILLRNKADDTPWKPAIVPMRIDQYDRIDGCSERRLFMGKGARFKEQEYIKELRRQQLESVNLSNEADGSFQESAQSTRQATKTSVKARAFSQDVNHQTKENTTASESQAFSQGSAQSPRQTTNTIEEAHALFQDPAQSAKKLTSVSEELSSFSQASARSAKQSANLSQVTRDYSHQESGRIGRPILSGVNSNDHQQRSYSSGKSANRNSYYDGNSKDRNFNKTMREIYDGYGRGSRPEKNSYKSYEQPNPDFNRGSRGDRNSHKFHGEPNRNINRATTHEQNSHKYYAEHNRDIQRGSRADQSSYKNDEEHNRDVHRGPGADQSSYKNDGEHNRHVYRGSRADQSSYKNDEEHNRYVYRGSRADQSSYKNNEEHNRDVHRGPRADQSSYKNDEEHNRDVYRGSRAEQNIYKSDGESVKNENNNDYQLNENTSCVSVKELNIPAESQVEEPPARPANIAVRDFREKIKEPFVQSETKEFHEVASNMGVTEVPAISNFNSRYTPTCQDQDSSPEIIPASLAVIPSTNHYPVAQSSNYSEINDAAYRNEELRYRSSHYPAPPGFQHLERSAISSCPNCTPIVWFEETHTNLRRNDPLLYKLLLQKQERKCCSPPISTTVLENCNETPINQRTCENCRNSSDNPQLPRNPTEIVNPDIKSCHSEEDWITQFQMCQRSHPPPVNPYARHSVGMPHPKAINIPLHDNSELNAVNLQPQINSFHENRRYVTYSIDHVNNAVQSVGYPINYIPYENVRHPMNPCATEFVRRSPTDVENITPDIQRQMQHRVLPLEYNMAPAFYPTHCSPYEEQIQLPMTRYHHEHPTSMPSSSNQYGADIAAMSLTNVGQNISNAEQQQQPPLVSTKVCFNNQKFIAETKRGPQSAIQLHRKVNSPSIPKASRGRGRLPQSK